MINKIFILIFFIAFQAYGYVNNLTASGARIHWPQATSLIDIYVNSQNTQGLSETSIQNIASTSLNSWNGNSRINYRKNTTNVKDQDSVNELYFSNDPTVFSGTGVIGITQVSYQEESGEIIEADILINDSFTFSLTSTSEDYLGNVITHEAGHFLGLGHSQVTGSTMFYALTRGQYQLAKDDLAGIYSLYPNSDSSKGIISGKIVGSNSLIPIFGAHVEAVSQSTGKVEASVITDANGSFAINGLSKDEKYYLYTAPIKKVGLPTNYNSVKFDFCDNNKSYRGSFFQSCASSAEGFPQSISLNSNEVGVGKISIRCNLDSPPEFMQKKSITPNTFDVNSYALSGYGGAFVGYVSSSELQSNSPAYFQINLSSILDWNTVSTSSDLYLDLKIINQEFFSPFKANIQFKRNSGTTVLSTKYLIGPDGWINIDTLTKIPINRSDSSDNDFEIRVTPEAINPPTFPISTPFIKDDLFPSYTNFQDSLYFYLVIATIVKDNGDGTYTTVSSRVDSLSDNSQCPDASKTYALTTYTSKGAPASDEKKSPISCATVNDLDGSGGNGFGGFFAGLLFSVMISYLLSKYSKLA